MEVLELDSIEVSHHYENFILLHEEMFVVYSGKMDPTRRVVLLEGERPQTSEANAPTTNDARLRRAAESPIYIYLWGDSHLQQHNLVPPNIDGLLLARKDLYRFHAPVYVTDPGRRRFDEDLNARLTTAFQVDYPTLHVLLVGSNDLRDQFKKGGRDVRRRAHDRVSSLIQQHEYVASLVDKTRCHALLIVSPLPSTNLDHEPVFERYADELRDLCDRHEKVKYVRFRELHFP